MVSVIIPTYEQKGFGYKMLANLLHNISRQVTSVPVEVLVTDNSKDDMCERVAKHYNATYLRNPDRVGVSANTNFSIDNARYDTIKPMYMDDLFKGKSALQRFTEAMKTNDWVISNSVVINEAGLPKREYKSVFTPGRMDKNTVGMPSCIAFRRNHVRFDESLKTILDMVFYNDLYDAYGMPGHIDKASICQRYWRGSISRNQTNMHQQEAEAWLGKRINP